MSVTLRRRFGGLAKPALRGGLALAGLATVFALGHALGWSRIAERLGSVGAWFGLVLAAYVGATLLYSLPLGMLLPRRPPVIELLASRLAAVSVNAATPFLGVGGEPVRLLLLPPGDRRPAGFAALVVDRSAFLGASALFLALGAMVAGASVRLPTAVRVALPAAGAVALGLAAALYLTQRRGGVTRPVARLLARLTRHGARFVDGAGEIDQRVRALHAGDPARFGRMMAIHFAGRAMTLVEVIIAARLLGLTLGATGALLFATLPLAVDLAFSLVPSQLGIHEGSIALLAMALGLDPAAGVALVFLQRLRQLVFVAIGFALLAARRSRPYPRSANSSPSCR